MIWLSLIIPVVVSSVLCKWFHHRINWWEIIVPTMISLFFIVTLKSIGETRQTQDKEWLTDKVIRIEHHEPYVREWEEFVPEKGHMETDSNGNSRYVVDVPAHWETVTRHYPEHWDKVTRNWSKSVTQQEYKRIARIWGKEIYKDLHHSDQRHRPGDGRGDMFYVDWPGTFETLEPITWTKTYTNKIQASHSVFNFRNLPEEITSKLYSLPEPDNNGNTPAILGYSGPANDRLMKWNAIVGPRSENNYRSACRMWILIFNGPLQDALDQEQYWKGGNKNEFILCKGKDWTYVISWTKNEKLKADVKSYALNHSLDEIVDYMGKKCKEEFQRREFSEFDYLTVDVPIWATITTYITITLWCVGWGMFAIHNEA